MFVADRDDALAFLASAGIAACGYTRPDATPEQWMTTHCDCKYGLRGTQKRMGSEQTGCPELRSLYLVVQNMTSQQWEAVASHGADVTHAQLGRAFGMIDGDPGYLDAEGRAQLAKGERVIMQTKEFLVVSTPDDSDHPQLMPVHGAIGLAEIHAFDLDKVFRDRRRRR